MGDEAVSDEDGETPHEHDGVLYYFNTTAIRLLAYLDPFDPASKYRWLSPPHLRDDLGGNWRLHEQLSVNKPPHHITDDYELIWPEDP